MDVRKVADLTFFTPPSIPQNDVVPKNTILSRDTPRQLENQEKNSKSQTFYDANLTDLESTNWGVSAKGC